MVPEDLDQERFIQGPEKKKAVSICTCTSLGRHQVLEQFVPEQFQVTQTSPVSSRSYDLCVVPRIGAHVLAYSFKLQ